jgi:16S rRNA processing protein RimM
MEKYLEAGKITNTHGIKGYVKFEAWFDSLDDVLDIKTLYKRENGEYLPLDIETAGVHGNVILMKLRDVDTFEDANLYKNKILYCDRNDLHVDEGSFFITDIKGLAVKDATSGVVYGVLNDVINNGATDVYEIKTASGMAYIPAVQEFIKKIDLEEGILISPIEGMFE